MNVKATVQTHAPVNGPVPEQGGISTELFQRKERKKSMILQCHVDDKRKWIWMTRVCQRAGGTHSAPQIVRASLGLRGQPKPRRSRSIRPTPELEIAFFQFSI